MSMKQIECVVMVAKLKSFTKAAQKLKIAQPSLSQSINILEKQIGVPLFDRTTTPISLTHAGEIYIAKASSIIDLYNDLNVQMRDVTGFENGKLRLGFSQTGYHFISEALPLFYKKFPNADIKITQVFSTLNLEKMLIDGDVDIATLILPLHSDELGYKILKEENACLALPSTHPLAQKSKKRSKGYPTILLSELKNEKFILPKGTQRSRPIFDQIFKKAGFEPHILCETETFDIANSIVASGIGVCFTLPQFIKEDKKDKLMLFNIDEPLLERTVVLAYKKEKRLSRIAQEFFVIAKSL